METKSCLNDKESAILKTMKEELVLEAGRAHRQYFRDLWKYRELFIFLSWRDILVRYKQTVIGITWAVIRPLLTMLIMTVVFGVAAGMDSGDIPYPLLVFCGLLPWQFFSISLSQSGNSLVQNASMISKVYFPRMIVPASSVITSLVDFLISAVIMVLLMVYYGFTPQLNVVFLPLYLLLAFAASFGAGLWISALMVRYRDFRIIVPFIVQFGLYATPVAFSSRAFAQRIFEKVPGAEDWFVLYYLNPIASVIDGFRWAVFGGEHVINVPGLFLSCGVVLVIIVSGVRYFRQTERTFADVI